MFIVCVCIMLLLFYSIVSWTDTLGIANGCENGKFMLDVIFILVHFRSEILH